MSDIASLQQRIQLLEDIEAIKKVTATYALYTANDWDFVFLRRFLSSGERGTSVP